VKLKQKNGVSTSAIDGKAAFLLARLGRLLGFAFGGLCGARVFANVLVQLYNRKKNNV
jgi:hypothetical protein